MKMELIASLLHKPSVFFLDEPTIGLDILSQQAIRGYLKEYNKKTGATIILTSHYTRDIEELCDHTIIINKGKKVYDGTIGDLRKMQSNNKIMKLTLPVPANRAEFEKYGEIINCEENIIEIETENTKISEILPIIMQKYNIIDFSAEDLSLEKSIGSIFVSSGNDETQPETEE
jgi:ABC-2 type transport system ATP-binding protein